MNTQTAQKVAASRIGISFDDYQKKLKSGEKWCTVCKSWHSRRQFNSDSSRGDGLKAYCRESARKAIVSQFSELPGEVWRSVPGHEGIYEASDQGRIRKIKDEPGKKRAPYLVKQHNSHGYRLVVLFRDGEWIHCGVHQIVCAAFHGPMPFPGMQPNHKDGKPWNNTPSNLEWTTRRENCLHAYRIGLSTPQIGEDNSNSRLTAIQVREIRALRGQVPQRELGKRYGVSKTAVRKIQQGKLWSSI